MGHAVIFQAFDRKTGLQDAAGSVVDSAAGALEKAATDISNGNFSGVWDSLSSSFSGGIDSMMKSDGSIDTAKIKSQFNNMVSVAQAPSYLPQKKTDPLTTISLFMPDSVVTNYSSNYGEVTMTAELGLPGMAGNAYADMKNSKNLKESITPYAVAAGAAGLNTLGGLVGMGKDVGPMAAQALGVVTNPQMQLLYRGINLREFQLEFILTPRTSKEAQTIKNICDSFTFYSLPGLAGAQEGNSGQFLTPPQIFSIQFMFLGQNGVYGNVENIISSALTKSGLGFLTTETDLTKKAPAKTFKIGECVLENVTVDYTPNGWATYNDGFPVQTHLTLQFREIEMLTKNKYKGTAIAQNLDDQRASAQTASERGFNSVAEMNAFNADIANFEG
jgi:hypothetical protein